MIYELYFKDVYRFVYSMCRDEHIAEEITQETFLKALKSIDTFEGNCRIKVWLCQIAKNTFYTHQTKQARLQRWSEHEHENSLLHHDWSLADRLLSKEDALHIHQLIHNMNEPYKEVFTLRVFGELSYLEISKLFGKSESWARVTFYRAKQSIQAQIKEASGDE